MPTGERAPALLALQQTHGNRYVQRVVAGIQAKLKVGQPGDVYEQEADRVEDAVMRMPEPEVQRQAEEEEEEKLIQTKPLAEQITPLIQRQVEEEEEEELIQTKALSEQITPLVQRQEGEEEEEEIQTKPLPSQTSEVVSDVETRINSIRGGGQPLPGSTRAFFEPRFGRDFSQVRVHTGAQVAESARAVNARAFTTGRDVVFGAGQYAPGTGEGRKLMAHELTHVVQQSGSDGIRLDQSDEKRGLSPISPTAAGVVQRAPSDFQIRQITPDDAANPDMIFFDRGGTSLVASERAKIAALAVPAGRNLTLNGFSSEEGSDAANDAVIQGRLNAVEAALVAAGHTGARARVNLRTSGVGQIDYRHMRSVEVIPTPVGIAAAPSAQSNCSAVGAINAPCGVAFHIAFPLALTAMSVSVARLANPADAMANALFSRLFSGVPRATINTNMSALQTQVAALPARHQCHSNCDAGCSRPAYQTGTGVGGAMVTLCPDFLNNTNVLDNAQTLVHESTHGTAGLSTDDVAYSNSRQITFLSPTDAVRNADSYVLLAFELAFPGNMTIGPTTPDVVVGMTAPEENSARRAVAWVESWLNYGDFDTEILYDTMNRSVPPALAWDTSQSGDAFNRETMHLIAPVFGLTDPGGAAPFVRPTKTDKVRVAAIHDRYDQMYSAINWHVLNVSKGAIGSGAWQSRGASLPRLGQNVVLAPAFFGMSAADQVKDLVLLMATAMSGISSGFRQKYVDAMDMIRVHRRLGP
jgi:hypothetical protein